MNNNDEYVGVDEQFRPEEDKKDNSDNFSDKVNKDLNSAYDHARDYVSDKNNQEKMKKTGRKGLKIAKGIGIGYLVFFAIVFIMVITVFIVVISKMFTTEREITDAKEKANQIIDEAVNESGKAKEQTDDIISNAKTEIFNSDLEVYVGTQTGYEVLALLDKVGLKIKKNKDHSITVIYDGVATSNTDDIIKLKNRFIESKKYEVTFDYDNSGFINKLTIFDK